MLYIGSHVSFDKGEQLVKSTKEAISYKANTFMFYTGAPQNTNRAKIEDGKTLEALQLMKENDIAFDKVIVHAPYIINLANRNNLDFSINFLTEELERCNQIGVKYLVLHPGSHVGCGVLEGIKNICEGLDNVFMNNHGDCMILLETMAGKGTEIGRNFLELKEIIDNVSQNDRLGICIDTCHLNDSGYDISNFDKVLDEFDEIIGIDKIKCIHVNDSKNELGSHKDRHENIGYGTIGFDNLLKVVYNDRLDGIPRILETPYIDKARAPYKDEIEMFREKKFKDIK